MGKGLLLTGMSAPEDVKHDCHRLATSFARDRPSQLKLVKVGADEHHLGDLRLCCACFEPLRELVFANPQPPPGAKKAFAS